MPLSALPSANQKQSSQRHHDADLAPEATLELLCFVCKDSVSKHRLMTWATMDLLFLASVGTLEH